MAEVDVALPLPTGDPGGLRALAGTFGYVGATATQAVLVRDAASGLRLAGVWAGPAHEAALAEAGAAARLIQQVGDRFAPAGTAVNLFADDLDAARRTVATLREEWLAADRHQAAVVHEPLASGAGPAAQLEAVRAADTRRERCRADLLARYAACMRSLETAETAAAHAVTGTLQEAVSPAGQRLLLLAQLPLSAVAAGGAEAAALVDRVLRGVGADPAGWSLAEIEQVLGALADRMTDPLVVRALMDLLGVEGLERAARVLAGEADPNLTGPGQGQADAARQALNLLALAFTSSVSDAPGADPASTAVLDQWRAGWLDRLLARPLEGLTAQLILVAAAATGPARLVPGYGYAVAALRALLAGSGPLTRQLELTPTWLDGRISATMLAAPDPYQLLLSSLGADPALARRVLLSIGTTGRTLLHELIVERPLQSASTTSPLTSSAALGRLVLDLAEAPDNSSAAHHEFVGVFLDALGEVGQRWWDLSAREAVNVGRHLDALRAPGAVLLTDDPSRVWIGAEAARNGGSAESARMRFLLGEIARDHAATPGPPSSPRLATLLEALAAVQAHRLALAMAADPVTRDPDAVNSALFRLGYVIGFTAEAATRSQIQAGQAQDLVNAEERRAISFGAESITAIPLPGGTPALTVASAVAGPAVGLGVQALNGIYPVDNAEQASGRREARIAEGRALVSKSATEVVQDNSGSEEAQDAASAAAADAVDTGRDAVITSDPARDRAP